MRGGGLHFQGCYRVQSEGGLHFQGWYRVQSEGGCTFKVSTESRVRGAALSRLVESPE